MRYPPRGDSALQRGGWRPPAGRCPPIAPLTLNKSLWQLILGCRMTDEGSSIISTIVAPLFRTPQGGGGGGGGDGPAADTHYTCTLIKNAGRSDLMVPSTPRRPACRLSARRLPRRLQDRLLSRTAASRPAASLAFRPATSQPAASRSATSHASRLIRVSGLGGESGGAGRRRRVCGRLHRPQPARRRGCPARSAGRSITDYG